MLCELFDILKDCISSDLQLDKLKENFLATQAFANPEIITEPLTAMKTATF